LISPAWGEVDLKDLADWVSSSGLDIRMQLQLHKYVWGPEARGV
jgi:7-carboxy-7-deazaguanine synthase